MAEFYKNLFDAHTHLNFDGYDEDEREKLAEEIGASNIRYIVDCGDNVKSSEQAVRDARKYSWCFAAVGIHPEHAGEATDVMLDEIKKMTNEPKVKAIGEIGLDFHYGKEYEDEQIKLFRKQIRLANELKMPIMIHTRDANKLTFDILVEEGAFAEERCSWFPERNILLQSGEKKTLPDARVQLHCYSGSEEMALQYIKLGATISIGGPLTFKNGKKTVSVVQSIPIECLLSETDTPYLAPEPLRGRQNKPQYVEHVVRRIAVLKGLEYVEAARILTNNGMRFFNIK